jgi:hypothetical protein
VLIIKKFFYSYFLIKFRNVYFLRTRFDIGEKMSTAALAPTTITLNIAGVLTTNSIVTMAMPFAGKITGAYVAVTTAPVGSALTADLKIGSNVAAAFSIAAAGTSDEGTLSAQASNLTFAKGALVSLDVSAVGSSTAGSNMTVAFTAVEG